MVHHLSNALHDESCHVKVLAPRDSYIPADFSAVYELIEDRDSATGLREGLAAKVEDKRIFRLLEKIHNIWTLDRVVLMHPYYYATGVIQFSCCYKVPVSSFFYAYELNALLTSAFTIKERVRIAFKRPISLRERTFDLIKRSDEILPISSYTAGLVAQVDAAARTRISGCGISALDIENEERENPRFDRKRKFLLQEELGIRKPSLTMVLFVGRLVPSKNVNRLIHMLDQLSHVHLIVLGDGPEKSNILRLAQEMQVDNRLKFVHKASENEKWEYLRAAEVLVLPSKEMPNGQVEGFGIVLLEAMAAGTPVIAAKSGGMIDVIDDGVDGLIFDHKEEGSLENKINLLSKDDDLAMFLVKAGRKKLKEKFNWKSIADNLKGSWFASSNPKCNWIN